MEVFFIGSFTSILLGCGWTRLCDRKRWKYLGWQFWAFAFPATVLLGLGTSRMVG